jgi:cholesterol oxidase
MNLGTEVIAEHLVTDVRPEGANDGSDGYVVSFKKVGGMFSKTKTVKAKGVVMAGGVLGTFVSTTIFGISIEGKSSIFNI